MKTRLLRKVRKNYVIKDFYSKRKFVVYYKSKRVKASCYYVDENYPIKRERERAYKDALDTIIYELRCKYPKLGFYNRGTKIWFNK